MSAKTAATANAEAPAKRGPGRPRKDATASTATAPKKAARKSATVTDISAAKRKPGRPSKAETEARKALAAKQEQNTASTPEPQRRRGRPLDPNSTMGQARTIFGLVKDKSRKNIVDLLHNQLGIDKNIAGVYYHQLARGDAQ